jgi:Mn-dependent DtxR family transcriptional regulator
MRENFSLGVDKIMDLAYNKNMIHNQSQEDYLETILLLSEEMQFVHQIDVARRMGVSQPAVQKALKILKADDYISTDGLHIYLTEKGKSYAAQIYERHVNICRFLQMHGVNCSDANADACVMEHSISDATYEMIKAYVASHTQEN